MTTTTDSVMTNEWQIFSKISEIFWNFLFKMQDATSFVHLAWGCFAQMSYSITVQMAAVMVSVPFTRPVYSTALQSSRLGTDEVE